MPKDAIDRTVPTPLYFQLKQILNQAIESGELQIGRAIPTEMELMDRYGLSRATVRQAVLQLVNEGYLRRTKGTGVSARLGGSNGTRLLLFHLWRIITRGVLSARFGCGSRRGA